jgi:hypothetical protein
VSDSPTKEEKMETTTTTPKLVTVDEEFVIEALAIAFAAGQVFAVQAGRETTPLSEFFTGEASDAQTELFGKLQGDGDDPLEVEVQARADHLTADALEANLETGLVRAYRKHAADMREAGTVNVPFDNELAGS